MKYMMKLPAWLLLHLAYERNDLEKAWRENSSGIVLGRETGTAMQAGQALFMLCKLHLTRGDYDQAHQALDQVDALFSSLSHPLSASLAAWRAHVWLKQVMLEDNPDYAMESAVKLGRVRFQKRSVR